MGISSQSSQEDTEILNPPEDHEANARFWKTACVFFIALFVFFAGFTYMDKLNHAEALRQLDELRGVHMLLKEQHEVEVNRLAHSD